MKAPALRFNLPVGQWIDLDGKLLRFDRRGRDRERSLVFEGTDGVPADMTDAELLALQQELPPRLRLLSKREPTPTFRRGMELTRLAVFGGGVGGGIGERGVIRGA